MNIARLDHLVLTVADIERTCAFYTQVLGMEVVTFGAGRTALEAELKRYRGVVAVAEGRLAHGH